MKVVVDGVFFQLAKSGIARVWSSILPRLAKYADLQIILLNRGNAPSISGIEQIDFPSYKMNSNTAADSLLIDKFCKKLGADVFTSTYYTSPITVPSVLMVYDMIPEVLDFDLSQRAWQEKRIAINFASNYACISERTQLDLGRFYPGTLNRSIVTRCGVEREIFRPRDQLEVNNFKNAFGILKPYYLLVGSREQHLGYKNGILAFKAAQRIDDAEIELVCVGGESEISPDFLAALTPNVSARRLELTDSELACAYSGAQALVFPSFYEGFGMPVIEAMACGCPVITTTCGSLGEVAGDAAIFVSGRDVDELHHAMALVRRPGERKKYIAKGLKQAAKFDWDVMTQRFYELLKRAHEQSRRPETKKFFRHWAKLRSFQADVDPY
jgi:glycosyltransferase involved in cell wall biosynthesis